MVVLQKVLRTTRSLWIGFIYATTPKIWAINVTVLGMLLFYIP
jgi:hypothetical protein